MSRNTAAKPWEGVLLVLRNGTWGTVCNDWFAFSSHQGRIACEEMGFAGFEEYVHPYSALYGDFSDMSPVIDKIICSGTEESILQCTMGDMADVHCSPYQYIALKCTGTKSRSLIGSKPSQDVYEYSRPIRYSKSVSGTVSIQASVSSFETGTSSFSIIAHNDYYFAVLPSKGAVDTKTTYLVVIIFCSVFATLVALLLIFAGIMRMKKIYKSLSLSRAAARSRQTATRLSTVELTKYMEMQSSFD